MAHLMTQDDAKLHRPTQNMGGARVARMKNPRRSRLLHAARFRGRGFAGAGAVSRRRLVKKEERTSEARVRRRRAACAAASGDWDGWMDGWMDVRGATWITSQHSAPGVPWKPAWRSRPYVRRQRLRQRQRPRTRFNKSAMI